MNLEYTEYRFPIIKPESWEKVFKGRGMPKEFMDLIDKMLMFAPDKRTKPIYLLGHPFFDDMFMTFSVLKLLTSIDFNFWHPLNI